MFKDYIFYTDQDQSVYEMPKGRERMKFLSNMNKLIIMMTIVFAINIAAFTGSFFISDDLVVPLLRMGVLCTMGMFGPGLALIQREKKQSI